MKEWTWRQWDAFDDNAIWALVHEPTQEAVVVDPGAAAPVVQGLGQEGLKLVGVLVTHHHGDHVGGLKNIRQIWPDVPVWASAWDIQKGRIPVKAHPVHEGSLVHTGAFSFEVWELPGHTRGGVGYLHRAEDTVSLFSGDVVFGGGSGKVFEGDVGELFQSFQRIRTLPPQTQIFSAHEYTVENLGHALRWLPGCPRLQAALQQATRQRELGKSTLPLTLATERDSSLFFRWDDPLLQKQLGVTEPAGVFACVRALRDQC